MEKIRYSPKKASNNILVIVANGVENHKTLYEITAQLKKEVARYGYINSRERSALCAYGTNLARKMKAYQKGGTWEKMFCRREVFDGMNRVARRVGEESDRRWRMFQTKVALSNGIFFMCSVHQNPAEDHKELQGKIYVNRYWRTLVSTEDYYRVYSYIRNHHLMSVQEAMGKPYYLTTRPYCRHWFVELDVDEVLGNSIGKLSRSKFQPLDSDDYYELRRKIYSNIYTHISSNDSFRKMSIK